MGKAGIKPPQKSPSGRTYYEVPRLWPGETFVCVASGPSLRKEDVEYVRGRARVIAVNNNYILAPWADVLYACDARWWRWFWEPNPKNQGFGAKDFAGLKFTLTSPVWPGCRLLKNMGGAGLEVKPHGLRTGRNGGYQAINLAAHLGAARILLLGYDMQRTWGRNHWHADHPTNMRSPLGDFVKFFDGLAEGLQKAGIEAINCSRETAIEAFPRMPIEEALPQQEAEAVA
jgi:hypothetical protein